MGDRFGALLNDTAFRQMLADMNIYLPAVTAVPLTVSAPKSLRPANYTHLPLGVRG
ncbi:hypothetical protein I552_7250 [Mycobacterium xenopi 3993]|nr:hypothetical protein I552_7250 [Mycobacterium xenopi 3993]